MSIEIRSGVGNGEVAAVHANRLDVSSRSEQRIFYESRDNGRAYTWVTTTSTLAAGDTAFLLKNTSHTRNFHVDTLIVGLVTASEVIVHRPATVATPTGTAVPAVNLNGQSANVADATGIKDETTNGLGDLICKLRCAANNQVHVDMKGALILGPAQSIAVDVVTAQAGFDVTLVGYFLDQ